MSLGSLAEGASDVSIPSMLIWIGGTKIYVFMLAKWRTLVVYKIFESSITKCPRILFIYLFNNFMNCVVALHILNDHYCSTIVLRLHVRP